MTLLWVWLGISGVIAFASAIFVLLAMFDEEWDAVVFFARVVLLSWLWPVVIPYVLLMFAFGRSPLNPTRRLP